MHLLWVSGPFLVALDFEPGESTLEIDLLVLVAAFRGDICIFRLRCLRHTNWKFKNNVLHFVNSIVSDTSDTLCTNVVCRELIVFFYWN